MLSFSEALVVFTLGLILVYLIVLICSERARKQVGGKSISNKILNVIIIISILVTTLTFLLSNIPSFKTSTTYTVLLPLIASLALYVLRGSRKMQLFVLFAVIVYHIILLYSPPPPVSIGERTIALAMLDREGAWNSAWETLNPTYNPVPLDIALFYMSSIITSIPYISGLSNWVIFLPLIVTYDLVLYILTKRITGSKLIGVFAVFILATTPPLNLVAHPPRWIASMLVLVFALSLIKALRGVSPVSNIVVANLAYAAAIFFHTSAAIGTFLLLGMIVIGFFQGKFMKQNKQVRFNYRRRLLRTALVAFIVITFTRMIYTMGYMEGILPSIQSFVMEMFSFEQLRETVTVLAYEQTVHPIIAYAWSTPIAMASALAFYSIIKRKALGSPLTFIFYGVGAMFLLLGFLAGAVVRAGGFYATMYPAFALLMPAAAVTGTKALKSSKVLALIIIALMMIFTGIAITDPMLSDQPNLMMTSKLSGSMESYIESRSLIDVVPVDKNLVVSHGISSCFIYFNYTEGKALPPWAPLGGRYAIDRIIESGEMLPETTYIWPKDIRHYLMDMPVSIAYDGGTHIVFFWDVNE